MTPGAGPITSVAFLSLRALFISTRYSNQPVTVFLSSLSWTTDAAVKNSMKTAILKEYSREFDILANGQADNLIRRWLETDIEQAKLRLRFAEIFRKVLPGKQGATFLQLERRISMMTDVQITSRLPLAQGQILALRESCPPWRNKQRQTLAIMKPLRRMGHRGALRFVTQSCEWSAGGAIPRRFIL